MAAAFTLAGVFLNLVGHDWSLREHLWVGALTMPVAGLHLGVVAGFLSVLPHARYDVGMTSLQSFSVSRASTESSPGWRARRTERPVLALLAAPVMVFLTAAPVVVSWTWTSGTWRSALLWTAGGGARRPGRPGPRQAVVAGLPALGRGVRTGRPASVALRRFLDNAYDRGLLRRVGDEHEFRHNLLAEHLVREPPKDVDDYVYW